VRTIVEARHASGQLIVDAGEFVNAAAGPFELCVTVELPGYELALTPSEARRLAIALLEHAAKAERPRRHPVVSDGTQ
jgi:hypothetical protein